MTAHAQDPLAGRSRELAQISGLLDAAQEAAVPKVILVEGEGGIGKSALLKAAGHAASANWLVVRAACQAVQSGLPLSTARQLSRSLLAALAGRSDVYAAGLENLLQSDNSSELVARGLPLLLDGVSLDHCVALFIDDFQWADADSVRLIEDVAARFADRALAIVAAGRVESGKTTASLSAQQTIALQPLNDRDAARVVEDIAPDLPAPVVEEIIRHARGYPLDIVAITEAVTRNPSASRDDVASSRRALIARDVSATPAHVREFLQICSLIGTRIEYRLLRELWPDAERLDALIEATSGRYFSSDGTAITFEHALIGEAVRQTVAVPMPYRRRIIAGIERLDPLGPEEHELLAEQMALSGDNAGAFSTLARLAEDASARGRLRLTISASERALSCGEPKPDEAGPFFIQYADALFALDRDDDAIAVLEQALRLFDRRSASIPGPLVARLILALSFSDHLVAARSIYERFLTTFDDPVERAHVQSAALWFAVCDRDMRAADRILATLPDDNSLPFVARGRVRNFSAYLLSLEGSYPKAAARIDEFEKIVRESTLLGPRGIALDFLSVPRMLIGLWEYGTRAIDTFLEVESLALESSSATSVRYFRCLSDFLNERWDQAANAIAEMLESAPSPTARRRLLAFSTAISALRRSDLGYQRLIEPEIGRFMSGQSDGWYAPLAMWWGAAIAEAEPESAAQVARRLLSRLARPFDPHVYLPTAALAIIGHRLRDEEMLECIARLETPLPDTPWHRAHGAVARAFASAFLGRATSKECIPLAAECRRLGLVLYADMLAALTGKTEEASTRLAGIGVAWLARRNTPPENVLAASPTLRELQVAELVASGKSNREIAEGLVLSQRTVEAHIANLFNKVGVSSRTQLTAWYLRRLK